MMKIEYMDLGNKYAAIHWGLGLSPCKDSPSTSRLFFDRGWRVRRVFLACGYNTARLRIGGMPWGPRKCDGGKRECAGSEW